MKLLVGSTSFPLKPGDSLSPFLWDFCKRLKEAGWEVTAVVPHHKGTGKRESWEGIDIVRFKYLPERLENLAYSGGLLPNLKKNPLSAAKIPFFIRSMYRCVLATAVDKKIDLVNFHWLFPCSFWLKKFIAKSGIPVVLTGHGTDVHLANKFPFKFFADSALGSAESLTLNSQYMKRIISSRKPPRRIEIIPMGTDTVKFSPGSAKPSDSKKILFIGRLIRQKGADLLLAAFTKLKQSYGDAELEIIGYGPEKDNILNNIKLSGLDKSVFIRDAVEHEKLGEIYRSARVLAFPSLIGEGFGMTPAEAAACGVPTVTFGRGGTSELVTDNETGLITEANAESLYQGLSQIFSGSELVDRLGNNARKRIEQYFSWEVVSKKFDGHFRSIIGK